MNPILYFAGVGLLWVCLSAIALGVCRLVAVCQDRKQVNPVEVFRALAVAGGHSVDHAYLDRLAAYCDEPTDGLHASRPGN